MNSNLTRRQLLRLSTIVGAGTLAAACGGAPIAQAPAATQAPEATKAPEATMAPEATKAPEPTKVPEALPVEITRKNTLMINWGGTAGKYAWVGQINPFGGMNHQDGASLIWSPLFYYSVFADKELPWVAESGNYNTDYTELTIKLRKGVEWSDGKPVTSKDVKWTMDMLQANDKVVYHAVFKEFVDTITAPDDATVVIKFKSPQPRFKFENLSFKFDTGDGGYVLPSHYFEEKKTDIMKVNEEKGTDMPTNGMFKLTMSPEQLIYDLREDWWGFKIGFQKVPEVKRVIFIPMPDIGVAAQRIVNNEFDSVTGMISTLIRSTVKQNPKITTHTGHDEPLGYIDWWPNQLWLNPTRVPMCAGR